MTTNKKQIIGLFGFGVVGESLYHVINNSPASNAIVRKICIKDAQKPRSLPAEAFFTDPEDIISDPEINLIVELINEPGEALEIVKAALLAGKSVVSGNKKMLAMNLETLVALQQQTGSALLYDASACGSIPVIRNLEEYYDNDLLLSITGILNGSSNYILSQVFNHGISYEQALTQAQEAGFAEADPSLDVNGGDALYKLVILALHGFGTLIRPLEVFHNGIQKLNHADIRFARERGYRIKLVAQAQKYNGNRLALFVLPKLVEPNEYIYNVENEYNGVVIEGAYYEKQFMFGKGAGGYPTGSSVLSDIMARSHNYKYEYKKRKYFQAPAHGRDLILEIYYRYRDQEDLNLLSFQEITERYCNPEYYYVVGKIRLDELMQAREALSRKDVFLAFTKTFVENGNSDQ